MFKRTRWLAVGYAAGISTSVYAVYKARRVAQRYAPPEIVQRAAGTAAGATDRVRDAFAEGRAAMVEREAELRLKHSRLS
jgi:hypothetical protein